MDTQIIGIKQLHTELKKISEAALAGQSFTVVKNSKPVFKIEPINKTSQNTYSLSDLQKAQFKCEDKDLSKKVDSVTYGV